MLQSFGSEAYRRHLARVSIEQNLREIVRQQQGLAYLQTEAARAQIFAIQNGFDELGLLVSNLEDAIAWSTGAIVGALEEVQETLSEIAWQQEQSNELLRDVLKTLRHPRGTRAEELRERGNEFYANALEARRPEDRQRWMRLALDAYQQAARFNPADFSVRHSIGMIHFFEGGDSEEAAKEFREAAALAEPYSKRHAAMSWLYLGYVRRNRKELEDAYQATKEALVLDPEWLEASYQHAVHCALTARFDEMVARLTKSIEADLEYFIRAASEPEFLPIPQARTLLQNLFDNLEQRAGEICEALGKRITALNSVRHPLFEGLLGLARRVLTRLDNAKGYPNLAQAITAVSGLWDSAARDLVARCSKRPEPTCSVSVDGMVAWVSGNRTFLWHVFNPDFQLATSQPHSARVTCVALSPDSSLLAIASGRTIGVWRVSDRGLVRTIVVNKEGITNSGSVVRLIFSADSARLVAFTSIVFDEGWVYRYWLSNGREDFLGSWPRLTSTKEWWW